MSSYRRLFLQHVGQTSLQPFGLEVSRAKGMYIFDHNNQPHLDFDSGISVSALGHCHPEVVAAVQHQAATYMHTMVYGEHIQSPQVAFAKLLSEVLDNGLDTVFYVNSGTEAVEAALKLARKATGRREIIACRRAYHGSTIASESLRSDFEFTRHYAPGIPEVNHISFNDEADLGQITSRTACVILEPVQAENGIIPPENDYLKKVRQKCDETGTLMILDEIQTGFGRTGFMFALQKYGVIPDILLIAKGMGGGMPAGALVANKDLMLTFASNPALGHITTFGGHPVCIAAALATLKVLVSTDYIDQVAQKEQLFRTLLVHPAIQEVRSSGLMMAVALKDANVLSSVIQSCMEKGVLTDYFLFNDRSFRIAPPLIITPDQIRKGVHIILEILDSITATKNSTHEA
ncbi:MAG: aspartate aminotransferase family protein [Chitinophagales bacterium]|nr:aspartate aminotransferase family protein [Chitinophagales bacterium]